MRVTCCGSGPSATVRERPDMARHRNNVVEHGPRDAQPMIFAHGFGCDQNMWRSVAPAFADDHRIVLFDHVGAGGSDLSAYHHEKDASPDGYATDPEIARRFARVTFLSDNRADLADVEVPTLVLQCSADVIAPMAVGDYVHR